MGADSLIERVAQRYRQRRANGKTGWADDSNYREKEQCLERILERFGMSSGARFLELGCGAGNVTLFAASKGLDAYGVDCCVEAIAWAKEMRSVSGLRASFQVGDVVELKQYQDSFFDLVLDGDCLHRFIGSNRQRCLANVFRVLKPGGVFHAKVILAQEGISQPISVTADIRYDPSTRCLMWRDVPYDFLSRRDEFLQELEQAGFEIAGIQTHPKRQDAEPYEGGSVTALAIKQPSGVAYRCIQPTQDRG